MAFANFTLLRLYPPFFSWLTRNADEQHDALTKSGDGNLFLTFVYVLFMEFLFHLGVRVCHYYFGVSRGGGCVYSSVTVFFFIIIFFLSLSFT